MQAWEQPARAVQPAGFDPLAPRWHDRVRALRHPQPWIFDSADLGRRSRRGVDRNTQRDRG